MKIEEYEDIHGKSPFAEWFNDQDPIATAKIVVALTRLELGNFSNVKPVGEGVSEYKIDFGAGYRIYFGMDGKALVILLGGGTKSRQQRDIDKAKSLWVDYKARKKGKS